MVKHDAQNLTRGIHAVLFAMFDRDERIDPTAMAAQTEYCVEAGCDGITVLGLATEVLKLTFDERCRIIDIVSSALAGRLPLSVTIAGNSVTEQRQLAQYAQKSGADWLILQPPIAGNYGSAEYIDFYARVGSGSTLPLAIQNAPQYLGRALSVDDIAHLPG